MADAELEMAHGGEMKIIHHTEASCDSNMSVSVFCVCTCLCGVLCCMLCIAYNAEM